MSGFERREGERENAESLLRPALGDRSEFPGHQRPALRYGMAELRISKPARRDRLLLISAIAIALLTVLGATGEELGYDRMLKANTVKRRSHSLFRQGCMLYDWLPNMPEKYIEPLVRAFADNLARRRGLAYVFRPHAE